MDINRSRYYQILPFKTACELSGIAESEIAGVVVSAIGEATQVVGAGRLFTLVGLLALKLSHDEALSALSFGLGLFDVVLEDRDGDGPWSDALAPAPDVNGAIAGYVWAGLGSPRSSVRWEAAHVVRALCTLGQAAVMEALLNQAKAGDGGAFADARLHFYGLHARQWLAIALYRAAGENPNTVVPYAEFLKELALNGEPHVLIREFAARALLTLSDGGHLSIDATIQQRLRDVNKPILPVELSNSYEQYKQEHQPPKDREGKRFLFGIDIGPYWFARLGRCFAKSESEVTVEVEELLKKWGHSNYERWDDDERWRRKIFKDRETSHSHGSYPRTDELRFYLAYHAMMVVAGKLLASASVHKAPDEVDDTFQNWLKEAGLTRTDGRWLADRRDPAPLPLPAWCLEKADENWRWSVRREDFERYLGIGSDRLTLWGRWTNIWGQREESVHVASALVSPARSESLLRALQTAKNRHDRIPDADDDLQIDSGAFQLKGWVVDRTRDRELDRFDPWSGDISYPPIKPACAVINLLGLVSDPERRAWYVKGKEQEGAVLWSQLWGHYDDGDDDESERGRGRGLQTPLPFITEFLRAFGMDLIVEVEIERRTRRFRYESYKDDGLGYSSQAPGSSSSNRMAQSADSDAVLALGKKLVAELGLDQSVDTLSRWMAHYIAELMQAAEAAEPEKRQELMSRCCAAILDLWQHRNVLPDGKRPFENIQPALRALESLDPDDNAPRYFRSVRPDKAETEQESETKQWLELAEGLDYSAKLLIQHCLAQAAKHALDKSREWVKQATEAGAEDRAETLVIRFLSANSENLNPEDENEEFRKKLKGQIARLDAFIGMFKELSDHWRAQLEAGAGKPSVSNVAEVDTAKTE